MTAVDHAELKRLAEGAGGDAWGLNDWRPEGQILVCGGEGHSYGLFATVDDALPDVAAFIAAANPAVVLELLSEIEGLKASASVIEPELGDLEASNKDLSRLLSEAERQLAALRTQAPDSWRPIESAPKDGTEIRVGMWQFGFEKDGKTKKRPELDLWLESETSWGKAMPDESWQGWLWGRQWTHWCPVSVYPDSIPANPALRPQTAESGK